MQRSRGIRRPFTWRIMALEELEGLGVTDRAAQARAMAVSLPHLDRIRRAARGELHDGARAARGERDGRTRAARGGPKGDVKTFRQRPVRGDDPSSQVSLRIRIPSPIVDRLRRYSTRMGVSMALASAVALDDWLSGKGVTGPSGLGRNLRQRLGL
jgi:hypothetical protein